MSETASWLGHVKVCIDETVLMRHPRPIEHIARMLVDPSFQESWSLSTEDYLQQHNIEEQMTSAMNLAVPPGQPVPLDVLSRLSDLLTKATTEGKSSSAEKAALQAENASLHAQVKELTLENDQLKLGSFTHAVPGEEAQIMAGQALLDSGSKAAGGSGAKAGAEAKAAEPHEAPQPWIATPKQKEGQVRAAVQQEEVAAQAAAAGERDGLKGKALHAEAWNTGGGPVIDALLEHTPLIDAQYLLGLHKESSIVPRGQAVPEAALIGPHNAWRLTWGADGPQKSVLVLSYPWLDREHPDREGEQLAKIAPILEKAINGAIHGDHRVGHLHGEIIENGKHNTVGVLWDYMCLPQYPRTSDEDKVFKTRLRGMNDWYAHPKTKVLLVTTPLPTGAIYSNKDRPYDSRGWCIVERRLSCLVKNAYSFYDLALGGDKGRSPPLSPDVIARELREGVLSGKVGFTAASDVELVIEIYTRGFVKAFETHCAFEGGRIWYQSLGWGKAEVPSLVEAIKYAENKCDATKMERKLTLVLSRNKFDAEDEAALQEAVEGSTISRLSI